MERQNTFLVRCRPQSPFQHLFLLQQLVVDELILFNKLSRHAMDGILDIRLGEVSSTTPFADPHRIAHYRSSSHLPTRPLSCIILPAARAPRRP